MSIERDLFYGKMKKKSNKKKMCGKAISYVCSSTRRCGHIDILCSTLGVLRRKKAGPIGMQNNLISLLFYFGDTINCINT